MLTPVSGQNLPPKTYTSLVKFRCDCGNECLFSWRSFKQGRSTCGNCELHRLRESGIRRFGKLLLVQDISLLKLISKKVEFKCECGNTKKIRLNDVVRGVITSCGCWRSDSIKTQHRYSNRPFTEWLSIVPELFQDQVFPSEWSQGSDQKFLFSCSCGKIFSKRFCHFNSGKTTCGECDLIKIEKGQITGAFIYEGNKTEVHTRSVEKDLFKCKCGNTKLIRIYSVFHSGQKTCGECGKHDKYWWASVKFGRLSAKFPEKLDGKSIGSNDFADFVCDCGTQVTRKICKITKNSSCGTCSKKSLYWFESNHERLKTLTFPMKIEDFSPGGPRPIQDVVYPSKKTLFECWLCKRSYETTMLDVIRGYSLSCGCASGQISKPNIELHSWLLKTGIDSELEHKIGNLKYDVGIPSSNLVIEIQGLRWHSIDGARKRDEEKYKNAKTFGFNILTVFEDEWNTKQEIFKNLILNKLGKVKIEKTLRPSECEIRQVSSNEADLFYEQNHYIGKSQCPINIGALYNQKLIACVSFRKPLRQNIKQEYELSRMASFSNIRIHGVWSKIMKKFILLYKPKSIVTYSDNRLFTGNIYVKLGFKQDGSVKPDYYWVKNNKRYHKSNLRKDKECDMTEYELRTHQGFNQIWDSGKTRWVCIVDS